MEPYETFQVGGMIVEIHYDTDAGEHCDPRQGDNLCTILHWHRRYQLGDGSIEEHSQHREAMDRGGFKLLDRYLRLVERALIVVPLGLIDHSGISMYVGGGAHMADPGGWDSGTVGYAYVTEEQLTKLCGDGQKYREHDWLYEQVKGEVQVYDQYLRGEVYGFVIKDPDGEIVESCWGFLGDPEAEGGLISEAKSEAEAYERDRLVELEPPDVAEVLAS
jgi:hypothetical protein